MKKYIIFTGTVSGIGGGQIYVRNKSIFVRKRGFKPIIMVNRNSEIVINDFLNLTIYVKQYLSIYPHLLSRNKRNKCIKEIIDCISYNQDDEIIIESHTPIISMWAELVSERIKATHFVFLLDEKYNIGCNSLPFFEFKFNRRELAVINSRSLELIFGPNKVAYNEFVLPAVCNNTVDDVNHPVIDSIRWEEYRIRIASIGRLDKEYVEEMINGLIRFAEKNNTIKMCFCFIGGSDDPMISKSIINKFVNLENVDVFITGYIFPIPTKVFNNINVFIGSAGSSRIPWSFNVPSISMDAIDHRPIGVLGYTTRNTLYRNGEPVIPLDVLLEKIIFENYLDGFIYYQQKTCMENSEVDQELNKHVLFISSFSPDRNYYSVDKISLTKREALLKSVIGCIGVSKYLAIRDYIRKRRYG